MENNYILLIQTQDFIYFNFIKSNDSLSKNKINKLVRKEHDEDYEEAPIKTIKNKILNYIIIETKCSDNKVFYNGKCIYCYELSYYVPEYSDRIWSQNGECVTSCDFTI